jgi:hypothetical protein
MFAVRGIGQSVEIALVEAEAFGGTAKEEDAFGEECEGAECEDERRGGELGFRGREEPEGSGGDGENDVQGSAAGMVFEVAGEVFEEEFAERHAESVPQNSRLSSGAKAQFYLRVTWELKLPPPNEKPTAKKEKASGSKCEPELQGRLEVSAPVWGFRSCTDAPATFIYCEGATGSSGGAMRRCIGVLGWSHEDALAPESIA